MKVGVLLMKAEDLIIFFEKFGLIIEGRELHIFWHIFNFIIVLLFFIMKETREHETNKLANKITKFNYTLLIYYILVGSGIGSLVLLLVGTNGILFSPVVGIVSAIKLSIMSLSSKKKKDDEKDKLSQVVNVTVNNNMDDENDDIIDGFFNPEVKLPEGVHINALDITMILEMYGYISPNQKYKMITSSIFETQEEQVTKLLGMYALEEAELKEAKAILNLIRLKKKLVTKEEALKYIIEAELKQSKLDKKLNKQSDTSNDNNINIKGGRIQNEKDKH